MKHFLRSLLCLVLLSGFAYGQAADSSVIAKVLPEDKSTISAVDPAPFRVELKLTAPEGCAVDWVVDDDESHVNEMTEKGAGVFTFDIDLTGWNWRGRGPYRVKFRVRNEAGKVLEERTVKVFVTQKPLAPEAVQAPAAPATPTIEVKWPQPGQAIPRKSKDFEVKLRGFGKPYRMVWQVDDGQLNFMSCGGDSCTFNVNFSGWNWRGRGPYNVRFVAFDGDKEIARSEVVPVNFQK